MEEVYASGAPGGGHQGPHIPRILRRRWKLVLVASVVMCAVFLPAIWLLIKPEFTATGVIEVTPVVPRVVFKDVMEMPSYEGYMNTQAALMTSNSVIGQVLLDPLVRNLPLVAGSQNQVAAVMKGFAAQNPRGTFLLYVSMTDKDPGTAFQIANAAMRAYLRTDQSIAGSAEDKILVTLEAERAAATEKLRGLQETLQLGENSGVEVGEKSQEVVLSQVQVLQQELVKIETSRVGLEAQANLDQERKESDMVPVESARLKKDYVKADPVVAALTAKVMELEQQQELYVDRWPGEKQTERGILQKAVEPLRQKLEARRQEVEQEFGDLLAQETKEKRRQSGEAIRQQLALLEAQKTMVEAELAKYSGQVTEAGRKSLALRKVNDEIDVQKREIDAQKRRYETYSDRIEQLRVERQRPARVNVASWADMPRAPSRDKRMKYSIVLVMGAVLCGCALAVGRHELTQPVEAPHDVEERCGLPVLGTLPRFEDLHRGHLPARNLLDDCRTIWVNLSLTKQGGPCRVLVVTSARSRDGKTSFAINFATSMALMGRRVLLIDGDLRKPDVARYLNAEYEVGLSDVLAGTCPVDEALQGTDLPVLDVLPGGRKAGQHDEPLANGRLAELVEDLRKRYDEIVIDTPPVLAVSDAKLWALHADRVVLVARSGWSDGRDLLEANRRLRGGAATVSGVVITGVRAQDSYERYQHRYAQEAGEKETAKKGADGGVFLVIDDVGNEQANTDA
jgi:capsular exopolysaccharide synthesis family protein